MRLRTQWGFSLTELMIALALSTMVLAGVYGTFIQQRRMATQQEQLTEARQIVRVTMESMLEELRDAGYDPGALAAAGIVQASETRLRFTRDLNCNGTLSSSDLATPAKNIADKSDEDIAYLFDVSKETIRRLPYSDGIPSTGGAQPVASNIVEMKFCYVLSDDLSGQCTSAPLATALANIRAVQVTLTARATQQDPQYQDPQLPKNDPNVHYRKATLTSFVRFRNLGTDLSGKTDESPVKVDFDEPCTLP